MDTLSQIATLLPAWATGACVILVAVSTILSAVATFLPADSAAGAWLKAAAVDVQKLVALIQSIATGKLPPPPAVPVALVVCLALGASQLTACAVLKPIARTAVDLAADLCVAHYTEAQGVSSDEALAKFCATETALRPWVDELLRAQQAAALKASRGER